MHRVRQAVAGPGRGFALMAVVGCGILAGCGSGTPNGVAPGNQAPHVEITSSPAPHSTSYYSVPIYWRAWDDDGKVAYCLYSIDTQDTVWTKTTEFTASIVFAASGPDNTQWHTFYVKSVDDQGRESAPAELTFNARTIAPQSRAVFPGSVAQGNGYNSSVSGGPALLIRWTGIDPDGVKRTTPVGYQFKRLRIPNTLIGNVARAGQLLDDPATPWQYIPSTTDTVEMNFHDLVPRDQAVQFWVFAWRAVDEAGAVEATYSAGRNLFFYGAYASRQGPVLTLSSLNLGSFEWAGIGRDSAQYVFDHALSLAWSGDAGISGATITGYRWGVDVTDINNTNDAGWATGFSRAMTSLTGLIFRDHTSPIHDIVVQVQDSNGAITSGVLRLTLAAFTGEKDVLWVDDVYDVRAAGYQPNEREHHDHSVGALQQAMQTLGRSTQIDTFDCYPVFVDPLYRVPPKLADMCRYKFVVWEVGTPPGTTFSDIVAVRIGRARTTPNPLSSYLDAGGSLVICGYAATRATMTPIPTAPPSGAGLLAPGRFNFAADYWHMCDEISWAKGDVARNGFQGADPTDWAVHHGIPGLGGFPRMQFDHTRWYNLPVTGRVGAEVASGRFALRAGDRLDPLYTYDAANGDPGPSGSNLQGKLTGFLYHAAPRTPEETWAYQVAWISAQPIDMEQEGLSGMFANLFYEMLQDKKYMLPAGQ